MKIAIIGAGNVGTSLARGWRKAGHEIVFGVRDPAGKKAELVSLGDVASTKDAAARAEVIVIAVPWTVIDDVTSEIAGAARGKTVIDVTNPIAPPYTDLAVAGSDSGGEQVARRLKQSRVVKAFNTVGAEVMANASYTDGPTFLPVAGDDPSAKAKAITLAHDLGFDPVDAGPLSMARYLEPFAMLWIKLALAQGLGRRFAFRLLRR
jgi:predicted dinucleotide-binding enzyme